MNKSKFLMIGILFLFIMVSLSSLSASDLNATEDTGASSIDTHTNDKNVKSDVSTPKTITLTNKNFNQYVTNGEFNDEVSDGDTIDVDGMFDSSKFSLNVNKSLNFISSKNNSNISLYTRSTDFYGDATGGQLTFGHGASGSNITNLYFYNTRVSFSNVSNVYVNNVSVINEDAVIGSGTGHFTVGSLSDNVTVVNSYFYTKDNGQHSTMVYTGTSNCLFENNTIVGVGALGNLVYLNAFNAAPDLETLTYLNKNFTMRNNLINATDAPAQVTCFAICLEGANHLIENNTVLYAGASLNPIYGGGGNLANITIKDNNFGRVLLGSSGIIVVNSIENVTVINNNITTLLVSKTNVYNNTIGSLEILSDDCIIEGNDIRNTLNITNNNILINNNTITSMNDYTIISTGGNVSVTNNKLASIRYYGDASINGEVITENNTNAIKRIDITDDNILDFGTYTSSTNLHKLNSVLLRDSHVFLNLLSVNILDLTENFTVTVINAPNLYRLALSPNMNVTVINTYLPYTSLVGPLKGVAFIENSTFLSGAYMFTLMSGSRVVRNVTLNNVVFLNNTDDTYILSDFVDSPSINNAKTYTGFFDSSTYRLLSTIPNNCNIIVRKCNVTYDNPMIIDKPVNITSYDGAIVNADVTFAPGSEGSNISGMVVNGALNVQANNVNVFNNTVKRLVMSDCMGCVVYENVFKTTSTAVELSGVLSSTIRDNTINTTADYTVSIDDGSLDNVVSGNVLIANGNVNVYSVSANLNDNTVVNNTPLLKTNISMELPSSTLLNTPTPLNVSISYDGVLVDGGRVLVLVDGVEQLNTTLTGGRLETTVTPTQKGVNEVKVWYYPEDVYAVINHTENLQVNAIQSDINITDISSARVGEVVTVSAVVKDVDGNNIADGEVIFTVAGDEYSTPIMDGLANVNITTKESYFNAEIVAYYPGSSVIDNSSDKTVLTLSKGDSIVSFSQIVNDDSISLIASVTDINGIAVNNGVVYFKSDNYTRAVSIVDGVAAYNITPIPEKHVLFNATFRNNNAFEQNSVEVLLKVPIIPTVIVNTTEFIVDTLSSIDAVLYYDTDVATDINDGKVYFKVNGKILRDSSTGRILYASVTDGVASLENYSIPRSWDNDTVIQAVFTGNAEYDSLKSNVTAIIVNEFNNSGGEVQSISVDSVSAGIGESISITVNVENIVDGKVVLKVNGKTVKSADGKLYAKVDGSTITFNYTVPKTLKAGQYEIKAVYTGASTKLDAEATLTVSV
ncbi:MAG: hypothetical protein BZ136_08175 [Methanosphaera sp. rholeuAM74]|nr:MAG: hypothetical protein BZ136_08175 [Methanosphaera sp. rholeuAM74]